MADLGVEAHVVGDMGYVCNPRTNPPDIFESLRQGYVGLMFFLAQCIDYQCVNPANLLDCAIGDMLGVGDISQVANLKTYNFQYGVANLYRLNLNPLKFKLFIGLDDAEIILGDTGVEVFFEGIRHAGSQVVGNISLAVNGEIEFLFVCVVAIWAQVVESSNMVVMLMGDQDAAEVILAAAPAVTQHLLVEVWPAINQNALVANLE